MTSTSTRPIRNLAAQIEVSGATSPRRSSDRLTLNRGYTALLNLRLWEDADRFVGALPGDRALIENIDDGTEIRLDPDGPYRSPWTSTPTVSSTGGSPGRPTQCPRPVADAFNNFRNRQNRELERYVFQMLEDAGIPFKGNIEPHHAAPSGLRLTGEINALAGDPARSRLWVCEVKDVSAAAPRTVADRVRKFTEPRRRYISKLFRSLSEVQASPGAAARLLGLPDPDRAWAVLPLMITRRVEPAAFTTNPAVTFVVSEDLTATLQTHGDPPLGQVGEHQEKHR